MKNMLENVNPIKMRQINGMDYCCLASGMDPRSFAHSAVTDYLHDACFRIASDGTVQEFYLNETVTFFNAEKRGEAVGIVLPLQEAQPLIGLACADDTQAADIQVADTQTAQVDRRAPRKIEAALRRLYRLFSCFIEAYKNGAISDDLFKAAVFAPLCLLVERGTDGGVQNLVVLSPRLALRCVTADTAAALRFHYPWVHPDAERVPLDDAASFFLASLSYACVTGAPPFNSAAVPFAEVDSDEIDSTDSVSSGGLHRESIDAFTVEQDSGAAERLVQNIRDGVYVPVALRCQTLFPQFARLIDSGLTITAENRSIGNAGQGSAKTAGLHIPRTEQLCSYCDTSLSIFTERVEIPPQKVKSQTPELQAQGRAVQATTPTQKAEFRIRKQGAGISAHEAEARKAETALKAFIQTARKRINRKRFFIRNRGKIAATAAAGLVVIAVAVSVVQHILRPPETAGMSAEAVICGFYTGVGTLDQTITGAYTKNKAAALYDGLMVHLYVTGKTREAYERKKIYYTPQEFLNFCKAVRTADMSAGGRTGTNADNAPSGQKNNTEEEYARYKKAVVESLGGGSVYGISGLHIVPASQAGWFDVKFYHWLPIFSSEEAEAAAKIMEKAFESSASASVAERSERSVFPVQVLYKHDRVQVISVKGSFFIGSIESAESTVAADSSNALLEDCALPPEDRPDYLKGL